jgi:iron(III) transport system substrate-binding protein
MFKPLALAAAVLTAFSLNAFAAKTELTVYTALEAEQLKTYKKAFEAANPDVEIKWVRDSTGIITAKLLAEKARPQADAVWGLAASSLAILDQQGMLQSYAPKDLRQNWQELPRRRQPAGLGGDGRVGRDDLLQHHRG